MRVVFPIVDGKIDFYNGIEIEDSTDIPEGYAVPEEGKHYKETGEEMTQEEIDATRNAISVPTETDLLGQMVVDLELRVMMLEGGV